MVASWADLPSLVNWTVHVAVCVTLVTGIGVIALWLVQRRSAPLRHALAVGILATTALVPCMAAIYQWCIPTGQPVKVSRWNPAWAPARSPRLSGQPALPDEPRSTGRLHTSAPRTAYLLCNLLAGIWVAGGFVTLLRLLTTFMRQRRLLDSLDAVTSRRATEIVDRFRRWKGVRRAINLFSSPHTPFPFTAGVLRPRVILPESLVCSGASASQLEAVLTHELAHVARLDYLVVLLAALVECVYWWNPFVRTTRWHLATAREEICDNYVLNHTGNGASLAEYLVQSVERNANARLAYGVGLWSEDPRTMTRRITYLLTGEGNAMVRLTRFTAWRVGLGLLAVSLIFVHATYARGELAFGTPYNLGPTVNSSYNDNTPSISGDGLTLYFHSNRLSGEEGKADIWFATRVSVHQPWQFPTVLGPNINTAAGEVSPFISADNLSLFFHRGLQIWQSTRPTSTSPWSEATPLDPPVNSGYGDSGPYVGPNGLTMVLDSFRPGGYGELDLWQVSRDSISVPWGNLMNLGPEINDFGNESGPTLSAEGLMMIFSSDRLGGFGEEDLWMSTRATIESPWRTPTNLGPEINTSWTEREASLSSDGRTLYFKSDRPGGFGGSDLWAVSIIPEPSALALLLAAVVGFFGWQHRIVRRR